MDNSVPTRYINLGSGDCRQGGWLNIDLQSVSPCLPDMVWDVRNGLPFADRSIIRAYAGHFLEHLTHNEIRGLLKELRRVFCTTGVFGVVGPDIDLARANFPEMVRVIAEGECRWPGDKHLWESTGHGTMELLKSEGWGIHEYTIATMPSYWPIVARVGWQFAFEAFPL